ncbi:hypothetical protein KB879_31685 (plasmid) [Cupriavidus sp. KK10]|jgi:hypothetical protein|uniref:hypothetical protein n=1 Tax=Cupriavidus sp. KK10 TaxID=1478019 RepID=UPI001BAB7CF9|nr:hypothetical protein [Cupriavidus sp. KK10]QUN32291.1 hypothetical protein KB879_31685 [Cupriavidus sp. KK10]
MSNPARQLSQSHDMTAKVAQMPQTRAGLALTQFRARATGMCAQRWAISDLNPA